jgi:hypothetical protein
MRLALMLLPICLLSACATTAPAPTLEQRLADLKYLQGGEVDHLQDYKVDGWQYVDTQHVILSAAPGRQYLLTLEIPCSSLSGSSEIAFTSTNSRLTRLEKLLVNDAGTDIPRSCPIRQINRLDRRGDANP